MLPNNWPLPQGPCYSTLVPTERRKPRRWRYVASFAVVLLAAVPTAVAFQLTKPAPSTSLITEPTTSVVDNTTPTTPVVTTNPIEDAASIVDVVDHIEQFYAYNVPEEQGSYEALGADHVFASDDPHLPTRCGSKKVQDFIEENAFYCSAQDYVAYDSTLLSFLETESGDGATQLVLAHELGHRVQAVSQLDADNTSLVHELQADCYAGAWYAHASAEPGFTGPGLRTVLTTLLVIRDDVALAADDEGAHGVGYDRTGAFLVGYTTGMSGCVSFPTNHNEFVQGAYKDYGTFSSFPTERLLETTLAFLVTLWPTTQPITLQVGSCPGSSSIAAVCDNVLYYNEDNVNVIKTQIGGFAALSTIVRAYVDHVAGLRGTELTVNQQLCQVAGFGYKIGHQQSGSQDPSSTLSVQDLDQLLALTLQLAKNDKEVLDYMRSVHTGYDTGGAGC